MTCTSNSISYQLGDTIRIIIEFDPTETIELIDVKAFQLQIYHASEKRNYNWLSISSMDNKIDESKVVFEYKLENIHKEGLYFVKVLSVELNDGTKKHYLTKQHFDNLFIYIADTLMHTLSQSQLDEKLEQLEQSRIEYNNSAIGVNGAKITDEYYNIFIFAVGCKIFHAIEMGYCNIYPLNYGLKYCHMIDAVNRFLSQVDIDDVEIDEEITKNFEASTPLFVINFKALYAFSTDEAINYAHNQAEYIMNILAYEQTHKPNRFATIVTNRDKKVLTKRFDFPGYYGNLASPFSISHLADKIDDLLPKIKRHPLIELVIRNYTDALNEKNIFFQYFKFWSVLETLAENIVPQNQNIYDANGDTIKRIDRDGNLQDVKTKDAAAKVYWLVYYSQLQTTYINVDNFTTILEMNNPAVIDSNCTNYQLIRLWEFIRGFYKLRNLVAHSGTIDVTISKISKEDEKFASKIIGIYYPHKYDFASFVKSVIDKNINRVC